MLFVTAMSCFAQDPGIAVAPRPAPPARQLEIVITGVQKTVQYREKEGGAWNRVEVGQALPVGAELRTGLGSAVRFRVGETQTVTLDRLGTIKVIDAIEQVGKIKTDVGMKYGRTRYDVEAAGIEHESTIHSPGASLAVRGTLMGLDVDPFRTSLWSDDGASQVDPVRRNLQQLKIGGKARRANMRVRDGTPGRTGYVRTINDPKGQFPRTEDEMEALAQNQGMGGVDTNNVIPARSGGGTIPVEKSLKFVLNWTGGSYSTTDLDLTVMSPLSEFLDPKGLLHVPSGGKHNGDRMGMNALEDAAWLNNRPGGTYSAAGTLLTTGDVAQATIFVELDFKVVQVCGPTLLGGADLTLTCDINKVP